MNLIFIHIYLLHTFTIIYCQKIYPNIISISLKKPLKPMWLIPTEFYELCQNDYLLSIVCVYPQTLENNLDDYEIQKICNIMKYSNFMSIDVSLNSTGDPSQSGCCFTKSQTNKSLLNSHNSTQTSLCSPVSNAFLNFFTIQLHHIKSFLVKNSLQKLNDGNIKNFLSIPSGPLAFSIIIDLLDNFQVFYIILRLLPPWPGRIDFEKMVSPTTTSEAGSVVDKWQKLDIMSLSCLPHHDTPSSGLPTGAGTTNQLFPYECQSYPGLNMKNKGEVKIVNIANIMKQSLASKIRIIFWRNSDMSLATTEQYYNIQEISVIGRCVCNGRASSCNISTQPYTCDCIRSPGLIYADLNKCITEDEHAFGSFTLNRSEPNSIQGLNGTGNELPDTKVLPIDVRTRVDGIDIPVLDGGRLLINRTLEGANGSSPGLVVRFWWNDGASLKPYFTSPNLNGSVPGTGEYRYYANLSAYNQRLIDDYVRANNLPRNIVDLIDFTKRPGDESAGSNYFDDPFNRKVVPEVSRSRPISSQTTPLAFGNVTTQANATEDGHSYNSTFQNLPPSPHPGPITTLSPYDTITNNDINKLLDKGLYGIKTPATTPSAFTFHHFDIFGYGRKNLTVVDDSYFNLTRSGPPTEHGTDSIITGNLTLFTTLQTVIRTDGLHISRSSPTPTTNDSSRVLNISANHHMTPNILLPANDGRVNRTTTLGVNILGSVHQQNLSTDNILLNLTANNLVGDSYNGQRVSGSKKVSDAEVAITSGGGGKIFRTSPPYPFPPIVITNVQSLDLLTTVNQSGTDHVSYHDEGLVSAGPGPGPQIMPSTHGLEAGILASNTPTALPVREMAHGVSEYPTLTTIIPRVVSTDVEELHKPIQVTNYVGVPTNEANLLPGPQSLRGDRVKVEETLKDILRSRMGYQNMNESSPNIFLPTFGLLAHQFMGGIDTRQKIYDCLLLGNGNFGVGNLSSYNARICFDIFLTMDLFPDNSNKAMSRNFQASYLPPQNDMLTLFLLTLLRGGSRTAYPAPLSIDIYDQPESDRLFLGGSPASTANDNDLFLPFYRQIWFIITISFLAFCALISLFLLMVRKHRYRVIEWYPAQLPAATTTLRPKGRPPHFSNHGPNGSTLSTRYNTGAGYYPSATTNPNGLRRDRSISGRYIPKASARDAQQLYGLENPNFNYDEILMYEFEDSDIPASSRDIPVKTIRQLYSIPETRI